MKIRDDVGCLVIVAIVFLLTSLLLAAALKVFFPQ
jgi:hypothetical protein